MAEENKISPRVGEEKKEEKGVEEKNVVWAIVAYLLFFVPLLTEARNDPFVKYHVKQGLILFISVFILCLLSWIPLIGSIIFLLGSIVIFVLWLIGILNATTSKKKPLPLIGKIGEKFEI